MGDLILNQYYNNIIHVKNVIMQEIMHLIVYLCSAANGLQWTGQPGMPCGCCGSHNNVVLSTDCFDTITA